MILAVCREVALAAVSPARNLCFHLDFDTRNMMEVASVCLWVSSPYSFHLVNMFLIVIDL